MSGSTRVERVGDRVRVRLETPWISFVPNPDGTNPEQDYHARAHRRFEAALERVWPGLEPAVIAAATALGLETIPLERAGWTGRLRWREEAGEVCVGLSVAPDETVWAELEERVQGLLARPVVVEETPVVRRWWWPFGRRRR